MLAVTSTSSTTSGFGRISGVVTTFSIINEKPGSAFSFTEAGETPGLAKADPTRAKTRAVVAEKRIVEGLREAYDRNVCLRNTKEADLAVLNKHEEDLCGGNNVSRAPLPLYIVRHVPAVIIRDPNILS